MPVIQVLLDKEDRVVGTARMEARRRDGPGPDHVTMVARPGQRVVEIELTDAVANLEPAKLHAAIEKDHLKEHRARSAARSK